MQRLSLLPSTDNGPGGKVWRGENSAGGSSKKWKQATSTSSSELRKMCSHLQNTSTSGMARTQPVPSAQLRRLTNTSLMVARPASRKVATPGGTTRSSRFWQQPLSARGIPPTPCPRELPLPSQHQHSSEGQKMPQNPPTKQTGIRKC